MTKGHKKKTMGTKKKGTGGKRKVLRMAYPFGEEVDSPQGCPACSWARMEWIIITSSSFFCFLTLTIIAPSPLYLFVLSLALVSFFHSLSENMAPLQHRQ